MIRDKPPAGWLRYDRLALVSALVEAKAAILSLKTVPHQRGWVETLQQMELKREVAGTSRIEGAEFTERELDAALRETPQDLVTRSQRQARAALDTYKWIATIPDDRPVDRDLICQIHSRIVTGADDDHCPPGRIRARDENVNFGAPRHRGAEGGQECDDAFQRLAHSLSREFAEHDPLIQALAAHYHLAAIHPFLDGNGRTARALEALMLQRAGLRDTCFIAMSNYYYDEKTAYLRALSDVRENEHELTPFLTFALKGVETQTKRLLSEIQHELSKELFRNLMYRLFNRLKTPKRRVIAKRQLELLNLFLDSDSLTFEETSDRTERVYASLKNPMKALLRDLNELGGLKAIRIEKLGPNKYRFSVRLTWPAEMTETAFFERLKALPKAKTHAFFQ